MHNKKRLQDEERQVLVDCHRLLQECISFENIEDKQLICRNLNMIKEYRSKLSNEMYWNIEQFIYTVIMPIVYDEDYFAFMKLDEYGHIDDEGIFVINSEHSLEMMIFLMYEHTIQLNKLLDEFAKEYLNLNIRN